jgi:hypothetical protein
MAYFNHAFQKTLIATDINSVTVGGFYTDSTAPGNKTVDIPAGTVAVVASVTTGAFAANTVINTSAAFGATTIQDLPMIYLAQGSINTKDKLGPLAGGYKESVKTKGINPKYVSKFFKIDPCCSQNEIQTVCICTDAIPQCGTSYYLRVDVKGSPALRFLSHNLYRTFASSNVCCPADPTASTAIDPMQVQTSWAWQIARDPIMSQFIQAVLSWDSGAGITTFDVAAWYAANPTLMDTDLYAAIQAEATTYPYVLNGYASEEEDYLPGESTLPCMNLIGAYVDTQFGTCSFHPQDFYELAPVKIYPSITDQLGDPCVDQIWCTDLDQLGVQGDGYGYKLLRDVILFRRYMQEQYVYDPRLREVMNQDQAYQWIDQTSQYTTYGILHSVPRFNNPTGVFDNDQYLVTIIMPATADCETSSGVTTFQDWMNAYLAEAGNGVQLEDLSACCSTGGG